MSIVKKSDVKNHCSARHARRFIRADRMQRASPPLNQAPFNQVRRLLLRIFLRRISPLASLSRPPVVRPHPEAHTVAFYSFGEALYGGPYYDTQSLENVLKPQCLLASEMNGQPLPEVYGAPLRLRVENQLGYKMVKWIERIEFVESEKKLGKGEGGKNEDDEYFDLLPNI